MGSKHRLLPWISEILSSLKFDTALDAFSGSGCVAYLLKALGKRVTANDFLHFSYHLTNALTANPGITLGEEDLAIALEENPLAGRFIADTFQGIFFADEDNHFLDNVWANLQRVDDPFKRSLIISAMVRACVKKQPRGVFTISGLSGKHDDGRRDLRLCLKEHFLESVDLFNRLVYSDGSEHRAVCGDVFDAPASVDLVYLDPPYVPRSDDNCYIKRYHFLEGLSCYWNGMAVLHQSKVKKLQKKYTPFSYRKTALEAFDRLFSRFQRSILVLSYSSNGYPGKEDLAALMRTYKSQVTVNEHEHRYHFGTHSAVRRERAMVREYLIVGT
ncbi:MAG: DNA adenine methylase [Armatimonadetes bacterium]|nr:DNA adenine methylase [Armatimonadota bacterium]